MEPFVLDLPADPSALAELRTALRTWLERLEIVEQDVAAIIAACSEVGADAIEAGPADFRGVLAGGDVVIRCAGASGWAIEDHPSRYVAALLVDDVSIDRWPDGVAVVLRKAASRGLQL